MCIYKLFYKMLLKNLKMLSFCEKIRKNACRLIIILYLCSANTKYEIKMSNLIKPEGYKALLDMRQTEMGIKMIKEFFQQNNAKLERTLKAQLGLAAAPYLLATSGQRPHTTRSLGLVSAAITLLV